MARRAAARMTGHRVRLAGHEIRYVEGGAFDAERTLLLFNGIGASLPMSVDGRVMYYAGHSLSGACKKHNMPPWACCAAPSAGVLVVPPENRIAAGSLVPVAPRGI